MKTIPLTQGKHAIVDDSDYDWLVTRKWHMHSRYAGRWEVGSGGRTLFMMHRAITNCPSGMVVDHINGDPLDNRRCNLRVCTTAENNANQVGWGTTGYRGVRIRGAWYYSQVYKAGKFQGLGTYRTKEEAAVAYDRAALYVWGDAAHRKLNYPSSVKLGSASPADLRKEAMRLFPRPNSSTGYVGVVKNQRNFLASVMLDGKNRSLGRFGDPVSAARARDSFVKFAGLPLQLNFPRDETIQPLSMEQIRAQAQLPSSKKLRPSWSQNGFRGVRKGRSGGHSAVIWRGGGRGKGGRLHFLGNYETQERAALAYDAAAKYFGEDAAFLNFPGRQTAAASPEELVAAQQREA